MIEQTTKQKNNKKYTGPMEYVTVCAVFEGKLVEKQTKNYGKKTVTHTG